MLHSVRRGDGPPLVLLAGIGMAGAAWDPVADRLAGERELWAVDLPGFGGSAAFAAGAPCGVEALADSVEAFLGEAGLERPHAAGNSLGGAVALELGRRGAVASVTALSPAGFAGATGGEFAYRSLQLTHRVSRALHARGPRTFARPGVRRLLCGQIFAHPERLTPDQTYANVVTLVDGTGFHAVLDALATSASPGRCGCRSRSRGGRATGCCCRRRRCGRGACCRRRGICGCAGAGTCR